MSERERRPWGEYEVLSDASDHKVKRITVDAGQRLSYQRHSYRAEHWFVVAGTGVVTLDASDRLVGPGDAIDIPVRCAHRIEAGVAGPLVFIEVQHGASFAETDIERLSDDYGRAPE